MDERLSLATDPARDVPPASGQQPMALARGVPAVAFAPDTMNNGAAGVGGTTPRLKELGNNEVE